MSEMHADATPATWTESICIEVDHPALPGHFPGRPVVPGVVLLDAVAAALQRWCGAGIAALVQVKFLQSLLPQQRAELVLTRRGDRIAFTLSREQVILASGLLDASPPRAALATAAAPVA